MLLEVNPTTNKLEVKLESEDREGTVKPISLTRWQLFSYAGFTNDRCCPIGNCRGDVILNTRNIPLETTLVLVKQIQCFLCHAHLLKFTYQGVRYIFEVVK